MRKVTQFLLIVSPFLFLFSFVHGTEEINIPNPLTFSTLEELITAIINFLFYVALGIAPLLVLVAAFNILTSAGDPKKIETAKNIIIYAVLGVILIAFAKGVIAVIKDVLK